jgi:3-deoxy-7-phosphoheptulonate synthase
MVERVVPILAPYKMASSEVKQTPTVVPIGPAAFPIGSARIGIIAGPCSVESRDSFLRAADAVKQAGAIGIRGGAYKPRTSPYSFQGMREEGLKILDEARRNTGLAIVTEAIGVEELPGVAEVTDVVQIGARNMQHYPLLSAAGKVKKPVLLKRGPSAELEEWLLAAEYIINAGNPQVIMCERGIRTFEDYCRNTLPLAVVPELKARTHLPVFVDPSHGTGHAHLVVPMCYAAIAAGADGLILEVHPDPEHALSDGAQSITPAALATMIAKLKRVAEVFDRTM